MWSHKILAKFIKLEPREILTKGMFLESEQVRSLILESLNYSLDLIFVTCISCGWKMWNC